MTTLPDLGDFAVTPTNGDGIRSHIIEEGIRWATDSDVNHAVLYVGEGECVEAQPGGARLIQWDHYGSDARWSTGRIVAADGKPLQMIDRAQIGEWGRRVVGTPYGFPDFVAIALAQKRLGGLIRVERYKDLPVWQRWAVERLGDPRRLICSQLVDYAYMLAGVHLFADGRSSGLVSPGDLARLIDHAEVAT